MQTKYIYLVHSYICIHLFHTGIIDGPNNGTMVKASSKTTGNTSYGLALRDATTQRIHSFGQGELFIFAHYGSPLCQVYPG